MPPLSTVYTSDQIRTHMTAALELAETALASGEFPVGCVIAHQDRILATGARQGSCGAGSNETDHAEILALRNYFTLEGPPPASECLVVSTMEPCLMCFGAILISGFRSIVYAYEDAMGGGTTADLKTLPPLYRDAAPVVIPYIFRERSLSLFQKFFSNQNNTYWKDSLLSQYTLDPPPAPTNRH